MANNTPSTRQAATAYEAELTRDGEHIIHVIHQDASSRRLPHLQLHSLDGFNWGYNGSGPADAARSILADLTNNPDVDVATYRAFTTQVLANQPDEGFTLTAESITAWLENFSAAQ